MAYFNYIISCRIQKHYIIVAKIVTLLVQLKEIVIQNF